MGECEGNVKRFGGH